MANYLYLLMNICVFVPLYTLSHRKMWNIHVDKAIWYSYTFVSLPFIIWDIIATKSGHWTFSSSYTLGINIFGLPFEELLFFFAVPFGCIYVWEALRTHRTDKRAVSAIATNMALLTISLLAVLLIIFGGAYSWIAGVTCIATSLSAYYFGWFARYDFWIFQVVLYLLFIGFNLILTAIPVVIYGEAAITGLRFITIPVEDFVYNFVLINGSLMIYEHFRAKS